MMMNLPYHYHRFHHRQSLRWIVVSILLTNIFLTVVLGFSSNNNNNSIIHHSTSNPPSRRRRRLPSDPIPITVLSGFLGSGKTTLLQHILQHGKRIAVIVNDVASVNIDSKLIKGSSSPTFGLSDNNNNNNNNNNNSNIAPTILELQNGCACCSLSDELLATVSELILVSDLRQDDDQFEHIVIELSGVADPKSVRAKFQEALLYDMPLMQRVQLDTLVTVIDCSVFLQRLLSEKTASPDETPELFYRNGQIIPPSSSTNESDDGGEAKDSGWDDMPPGLLEVLGITPSNANANNNNNNNNNGVADLLVGQTETADVLLLNKVDLLLSEGAPDDDNDYELDRIEQICRALNPRATILKCQFGNVPMDQILAVAGGMGVVEAGIVDDHRDAVQAAATAAAAATETTAANGMFQEDYSHSHDEHGHSQDNYSDPDCNDPSHVHDAHSHHDHKNHNTASSCTDPDFTDPSHAHSHEHHHNHNDNHAVSSSCVDPDCTDPSHQHYHEHQHQHDGDHDHHHAGIGSFVYRARRPFHPGRLVTFLRRLPVVRGLPEREPEAEEEEDDNNNNNNNAIHFSPVAIQAMGKLLRSKGFVWCADSDIAALYWSHAGSSFEMQCVGRWWATLARQHWPKDAVSVILADFDDVNHNNDDEDDDDAVVGLRRTTSVGDRRQEIVFIGLGAGRFDWQREICQSLNQCLLTDDEWSTYQQLQRDEKALRMRFANPVQTRVLTY